MPQEMVHPGTTELTYRDAVREAIRDAMRRDDRVFLMGEDVGHYGGCYAVSKGLLASSAPSGSAIRPCRSPASPAPASVRRWPVCDQSSS